MPAPSVDAYLAELPESQRTLLDHVRAVIHEACPEVSEAISYGMPAFEVDGRKVLWLAAFKHHCSLYPASREVQTALGDTLTPFLGAKSAIRFTSDRPIPDDLLRRLIAVRLAEVGAR